MSKFNVGDKVKMVNVAFVVEVLEIGTCNEYDCDSPELFRFEDPATGADDWAHSDEFEKVE
jgi:hypothetical protein